MGDLSMATTIFGQVVSYKQQYQDAMTQTPGLQETGGNPGNILDQLHRQAIQGENWLSSNGFGTAAAILQSDNAQQAQDWLTGHPDLGTGQNVGGGSTGGGGGGGSGGGGGGQGFWGTAGSDVQGFLTGIGSLLNAGGQAILNPKSWLDQISGGVGDVGMGIGGGAQAAGTGIANGFARVAPWVLGGLALVWLAKGGLKLNIKRDVKTEGRPLL